MELPPPIPTGGPEPQIKEDLNCRTLAEGETIFFSILFSFYLLIYDFLSYSSAYQFARK